MGDTGARIPTTIVTATPLRISRLLLGLWKLKVPRDRKGEFEPQIVKKRQSMLDEIENQIVVLYSKCGCAFWA